MNPHVVSPFSYKLRVQGASVTCLRSSLFYGVVYIAFARPVVDTSLIVSLGAYCYMWPAIADSNRQQTVCSGRDWWWLKNRLLSQCSSLCLSLKSASILLPSLAARAARFGRRHDFLPQEQT